MAYVILLPKQRPIVYTPKILDELGDLWFYLRILAYQQEVDLSDNAYIPIPIKGIEDMSTSLFSLNYLCAELLVYQDFTNLQSIFEWFLSVVFLLDCTLDQLTELNWAKLKDGDNHGWAKTLES